MSHEDLLIVKGLIIVSALVGYKIAILKGFKGFVDKDKKEKNDETK
jgi:hypothetical protein